MFVFGFIVGFVVAIGAVWLLVQASSLLDDSGLSVLSARRRINEIERAAISRMLAEAETTRHEGAELVGDIIDVKQSRPK